MRIFASHEQGKRYVLLQGAAVSICYTDILQTRAGKAIHTPPGEAIEIFYTDILQPRAGKAIHTPPGSSYRHIPYGYPRATSKESDTHSSWGQK